MGLSRWHDKNSRPAEEKSEEMQQDAHYYALAASDSLNASVSNEYGNQVMNSFWKVGIDSPYVDDEAIRNRDVENNLPSLKQSVYNANEPNATSSAFSTASYAHETFDFRNLKLR
ncbi:AQG_2a_G0016040.mRNA.1.CDS.1 [Saccharomyces cerevisiae]|uniref:Uncharacterized protein YER121W n=2 Tax=Saccharomyces TaxID=4930 RepID=YEV1_YEAST|nr:uncharacterized protein YER121W [Saccharomyces cerevisiae S288C]P40076.1 RecName: Full=Uncharacterized protein YER121W [Saccharomyces cerevisiae S288C]AAC03219.1 Yer121wp [Saccharomyces cerevisiae]AHY75681.1 hypothetical protein H779_YJM993E00218 [Saccharomyces cerevisiae YJM993]AJP38391.1 hypothetical protein F842_YJM1078E00218 [Saccharomyces cerevisiae YJM1078]AJU40338.1 hypothetical protein H771_YJM969E00217 [Saccharomyces cerevisiae YJM969]AJU40594.1 hypothetical protein H772_YJM972E00|eukprot:NP_011047.3 hypothetical protein YER121W [Saccharomyces cerevisiae S288C]